jgi:ferritin-like metal-binding protein YciE
MKIQSFQELYLHELQDLYNAEHQITKALPKMANAAQNPQLRAAFEEHLMQTKGQIERLERIFTALGEKPGGVMCKAMEGLAKEGDEIMKEVAAGEILDAALIAAAQRVEHYEMAGYGTARTYAHLLGHHDQEKLLQATLDEEGQTDKKLNTLAEKINNVAVGSR